MLGQGQRQVRRKLLRQGQARSWGGQQAAWLALLAALPALCVARTAHLTPARGRCCLVNKLPPAVHRALVAAAGAG